MKFLFSIILIFYIYTLSGLYTPSSLAFANSYLQRSGGAEALYWNPANILSTPHWTPVKPIIFATEYELMLLPYTFSARNNLASFYSFEAISGSFLEEEFKKYYLNRMNNSFYVGTDIKIILAGFSSQHAAFSTAINFMARGQIDKQILEIATLGNTHHFGDGTSIGKDYVFKRKNNDINLLSYQDVTIGVGGFMVYPEPAIYAGFSLSALYGVGTAFISHYKGIFYTSSQEGATLEQEAAFRTGALGLGMKGSFGFSVDAYQIDVNQYISAGISFDNIGAFIRWHELLEETKIYAKVDPTYGGDFDYEQYEYEITTERIDSFVTKFPFNFKLGGLYRHNDMTASLDYSQNLGNRNTAFYYNPEISLGFEYNTWQFMPVQIGYRLPIGLFMPTYSVGIGLRFPRYEINFSGQSVRGFFNYKAEGVSLSSFMKFRF